MKNLPFFYLFKLQLENKFQKKFFTAI